MGLDVGSTTVKVVVTSAGSAPVVRCARHQGRLAETVVSLLDEVLPPRARIAVTGSGSAVAAPLGAYGVHEVTAAAEAVARRHPEARTLIDLGGQDAKLVTFERGGPDGARPHVAMNDRCAAGTGVTLERCLRRIGVGAEAASRAVYRAEEVHPLSARCGVFAETDLVNLARRGVGVDALVASLADAIVLASLGALARGITPKGPVVLLGGPHVFLPALTTAWRRHLAALWRERGIDFDPRGRDVFVPDDALYYPALGAALRCEPEPEARPRSRAWLLRAAAAARPASLAREERALEATPPHGERPAWPLVDAPAGRYALGIDAGSTVTKAVLLDGSRRLLAQSQRASGDPVDDARSLLAAVKASLAEIDPAATLSAVAVTGYGSAWVAPLVGADLEVVETLAHARSARAVMPGVEVVCDVGGQDIKVLALERDGSLREFWVSSQCSAGIGMVLESTAREFGVERDRYAERAFAARRAPRFDDGCVVFVDAARVGFQREGYEPGEILAGLARALPRIVWTQVMNGVSPATLGRSVLLQGGVQRNEAAVRAQVDHLDATVPGVRVAVHPYPELAGALGAALLALDGASARAPRPLRLPVATLRASDELRCELCENRCPRAELELVDQGERRSFLVGHGCEAGGEASPRDGAQRRREREARVPDLYSFEARQLFVSDPSVKALRRLSRPLCIGIPRVLAQYRAAPFFRAYLEALGVAPRDVVFSPATTDALWREGAHHGSTDPCFPVKVTLAHVHHLLHRVHDRGRRLDALFVPRVTHAVTPVRHAADCASCPVVAASPALVRASFGADALSERGIALLDPEVALSQPERLRSQMFSAFRALLGMSRDESDAAVDAGVAAVRRFEARLHARAGALLSASSQGRGAVLVLARPYHADPGLSHHVGAELQSLGYPSMSTRAIPRDESWLRRIMSDELRRGVIADPFDVRDLLPECDNSGGGERLWAARVAARHGGLGVLDLSSFKCAQDAPTYAPVRSLLSEAGAAYCALHDLDETRPRISLRMRLRTFVKTMQERGLGPWS